MIKGKIITGEFGKILARQKSDQRLELGELLIAETDNTKILLQVFDLLYGSQISQQNLELISGMSLEENTPSDFIEGKLRNYNLALLKNLITIKNNRAMICKELPEFFSGIREIEKSDLEFLTKPRNPLFIGKLRSGSKTLDVDIFLDGDKVFSHHILIAGTTGRGKSVLVSNMLWNILNEDYAGILVLDPHDEYYGRNKIGLKEHKNKERVVYYTAKNPPVGCKTLKINLEVIRPHHFEGVMEFSDAQRQAINLYYKKYNRGWIEAAIQENEIDVPLKDDTIAVIKRKLLYTLDLEIINEEIICRGVFDKTAGTNTIKDITEELENRKVVIIDTSSFSGVVELLIGSLIANEILNRYKFYKINGQLKDKPVISIVLEEAPRVLGKEILEKGSNVFSTIAREGRKFKVGLTAITQLPSLIPREILANMNTKIILGVEMKPERQAIIDSASQDLSEDDRNIASLDTGEAIVTSNFARFALPVKIPFFDEIVMKQKNEEKTETQKKIKKDFSGLNLS